MPRAACNARTFRCCLKSSLTSGSLIFLTRFTNSFPHIPSSSTSCGAWLRVLLGSDHFDRRLSIAWVRFSSFSNFIFSACVGSLKDFICFSFSFSFSLPLRSFLAFFFGLSATRGVSLGVKAGRPVGVLGSGSPTFGTAGSAARRLVGVFTISSAEYCPTFATTISGGGGGEDGSGMTGSSYSSCPSFWGVVSFTTCGVSCGVSCGACCGACCGVSFGRLFSFLFRGVLLGSAAFLLYMPAVPEVDGVTLRVVSLDLAGPST